MNPFVLHHHPNPEYFCDRVSLLNTLQQHLDAGRNLMLFGERRMGKTALLKRVLQDRRHKVSGVLVDLMPCENLGDAVTRIANALLNHPMLKRDLQDPVWQRLLQSFRVAFGVDALTGMPSLSIGFSETGKAGVALTDLAQYLTAIQPGFCLFIDEFQQITHFPEKNAEAIFRTWMQAHPEIRFAFSGSQTSLMSTMFNARNRPFYNSCSHFEVGAIPEDAYIDFMRRHFAEHRQAMPLDTTFAQIYSWANGITHWIQDQANRLYDHENPASASALRDIQHAILHEAAPYFRVILNQLRPGAVSLLRSLAANPAGIAHPMSQEHIQAHALPAASTLSSMLKNLEAKGLVRQEPTTGHWRVSDPLLGHWLRG